MAEVWLSKMLDKHLESLAKELFFALVGVEEFWIDFTGRFKVGGCAILVGMVLPCGAEVSEIVQGH